MKVGDLVRVMSAGNDGIVVRSNGIISKVEMGKDMEPYNIPACLVHWPDNVLRWEFLDAIEVITK